MIALALVFALFAVKMGYDMQQWPTNYYSALEVTRHSNTLDIRRSYKQLSKRYHPDKNPDSATAEEMFQNVKTAYDVLMDESQRDIYNRFGPGAIAFDPRKDEMKLISDIGVVYLFWTVSGYLMTLPVGARASRTWMVILGIALLAVQVSFCLTETQLPAAWVPERLTEHEVVLGLHCLFPLLIVCLRILAESMYVDADATSIAVLKELCDHQKAMNDMVQQLQSLLEIERDMSGASSSSAVTTSTAILSDASKLEEVQGKLSELRDQMDQSNETTSMYIETLKNCSNNPGANYYWLIFVVMYGGMYFMQ